jgi:diaminopimelate decarboxylase
MPAEATKPLPVARERLAALARAHGTPLYVYDAATVRTRCAELRGRFDVVRYAQKANGNLALLRLLRAEGCAIDAVSAGEVERARAAGFQASEIVFTSDLFDRAALAAVARERVAVNLGSRDMLAQYAALGLAPEITLRVNPGFGSGHGPAVTTGGVHSKHGIWHEELPLALSEARARGLVVTGLHVHVGSGAKLAGLVAAAGAVRRLAPQCGRSLARLSAGGGIPIPYRAGEARADLAQLSTAWRGVQRELERELDRPLELEVEPGRFLVAECGVLVSEVRAVKKSGPFDFVLVDAGFHNLVRPVFYGAWHEISPLTQLAGDALVPQVVAGPLCESSDVFTQDAEGRLCPRLLPRLAPGDLVAFHDAGAYGASMASHYNAQPLAPEVLVDGDAAELVRARRADLTDA